VAAGRQGRRRPGGRGPDRPYEHHHRKRVQVCDGDGCAEGPEAVGPGLGVASAPDGSAGADAEEVAPEEPGRAPDWA
jgi:hypothetical protein